MRSRCLPALACCFSLAACADAGESAECNADPIDVEVRNETQYRVLDLRLDDGDDELGTPLAVGESVIVRGFVVASTLSFLRERPDASGPLRVTSESPLCPSPGEMILLFDASFRIAPSDGDGSS